MFAIIETGGKQYKIKSGDKVKVEKIVSGGDGAVIFDRVLLLSDGDKTQIGTPYVQGAEVKAKVLREGRYDKKIVFRYHSKTRYRKKKGHRQHFTEVEIVSM